jgi:hypothetical protein
MNGVLSLIIRFVALGEELVNAQKDFDERLYLINWLARCM